MYDIFIYELDVTDCVWFILNSLIERNKIKMQGSLTNSQKHTLLIKMRLDRNAKLKQYQTEKES